MNNITYRVEYPGLSRWGFWYTTREFTSLLAAYRFFTTREEATLTRFKKFGGEKIIVQK